MTPPAAPGLADLLDAVAGLVDSGVAPVPAAHAVTGVLGARMTVAAALSAGLRTCGNDLAAAAAHARARPGLNPLDSRGLAWLSQAMTIAEPLGLPVHDVLAGVAREIRADEDDVREAQAAAAGPRAGALVLTAMPAASLLLGYALGADPPAALTATPAGRACLLVGVTAWGCGHWWMRRLVAGALRSSRGDPDDLPEGIVATLVAVGVEAGLAPETVMTFAAGHLTRLGHRLGPAAARLALDPAHATGRPFADDLGRALTLARVAGVPPGALVRQAGQAHRRREAAARRAALSRLPVLLVLPSGLALLPASIALGVVPVVLDLLTRTLSG